MLPTLHQVDEEESLIRLGQYLPAGVCGNQVISHTSAYSYSSSSREIFWYMCEIWIILWELC